MAQRAGARALQVGARAGFVRTAFDFGRLSAAGLGLSCVVIGTASGAGRTWPPGGLGSLAVALLVGLCFHVVAFALNDILDLPIDATNPERAHSPLVSGRVGVPTAWTVVAALAAGSFVIDIVHYGRAGAATVWLAAGFAGLTGYDVLTKRTRWPMLTDVLQGLGWAGLLCYAAARSGGPTWSTVLGAVYVLLFVVLVNGVHGGLRDLRNDTRHGGRTTATVLGAHLDAGGGYVIPDALARYAIGLQVALAAVAVMAAVEALARGGAPGADEIALATGVAGSSLLALVTLVRALRNHSDPVRFKRMGAAHILACFTPVMFATALWGGVALGLLTAVVMAGPMLGNPSFRTAFGLARHRDGALPSLVRSR